MARLWVLSTSVLEQPFFQIIIIVIIIIITIIIIIIIIIIDLDIANAQSCP